MRCDDGPFSFVPLTVMPYNSAHHCVVEVENFLLLLGGEDQWNPNGTSSHLPPCQGGQTRGKRKKNRLLSVPVGIYKTW